MFERYTERSRRVIFFARYEALQYGSPVISPEHILLGLVREDKTISARFFPARNTLTVDSVRREVEERIVLRDRIPQSSELHLSQETKRILFYASEESRHRMSETPPNLGKLVSVHPIAPVFLQRAAFISVLAFLFFLGMMFAFYVRQSIGYFLLATAFLLLYLVTMFSLVMQKRSIVKIFQNGITYRKFESRWDEIEAVVKTSDRKPQVEIQKRNGGKVVLPGTIQGLEQIAIHIKDKTTG